MFFVIETQVDKGKGSTLVTTFNTRNEAESDYHRVLQYAAISSVDVHGAVILNEDCTPLMNKAYRHNEEVS